MPAIEIFDPALCCSTGVCGPEVDDALVELAADALWVKARGGQDHPGGGHRGGAR